MNYQTTIQTKNGAVTTLSDILPEAGPMKMLIIGKTPALESVDAGHYFQGHQGRMFWNRLADWGLLKREGGKYEDELLLTHGYGITDIVKVPRNYRSEPSADEYREGLDQILTVIRVLKPTVILFVYKKVLDQILSRGFGVTTKAVYGENPSLKQQFGAKVFVFPMPGTPCTSADAERAMRALTAAVKGS